VDRLSGSDHILMSEMQQRVAALTGIPVHADDAGHGGLESDARFFGGSCRDMGQSCLLDRQNCSNMTIYYLITIFHLGCRHWLASLVSRLFV